MNRLDFQKFIDQPTLVKPYDEIANGIFLAYDRSAISRGTSASVRNAKCAGVPAMILDGVNFANDWFGLEISLGDEFKTMTARMQVYPAPNLYPRVYYDGGSCDLMKVEVGVDPFDLTFTHEHLIMSGVPEEAQNIKLALLVPSSDWFSIGIFTLEVTGG